MWTVLLPPDVNPIPVDKYIISYHIIPYQIIYHIISYGALIRNCKHDFEKGERMKAEFYSRTLAHARTHTYTLEHMSG